MLGTATLYGWRGIKALAMLCGMGPPYYSLLIGTAGMKIISTTGRNVSTKHTTTMLFFIYDTHIPGRYFLFLINCEYFCRRFTSGILNYKQDESTNINKRDGKKKNRFISRFPYFAANHGRIWISGTDLWHLHA